MCVFRRAGLMWPALTLPYTICHSPHYREGIGTEHQRSSLRVTLHRLFQHCCSASLPLSSPPGPSHIHISYLDAKHASDTHAEPSKCICKIRSVLGSYLCLVCSFQLQRFILLWSFILLSCSRHIACRLIVLTLAPTMAHF